MSVVDIERQTQRARDGQRVREHGSTVKNILAIAERGTRHGKYVLLAERGLL